MPTRKVDFSEAMLAAAEAKAAHLGMSLSGYVKFALAVDLGADLGPISAPSRPQAAPAAGRGDDEDGPKPAPSRPETGPDPAPSRPRGGTIGGKSVPPPTSTPPEDYTPPPPSEPAKPSGFDRFWTAYPRKVGKRKAAKAWKKTAKERPPTDDVIAAVEKAKRSTDWTKEGGTYIPYPATWLNAGRWEDDPESLNLGGNGSTVRRSTPGAFGADDQRRREAAEELSWE